MNKVYNGKRHCYSNDQSIEPLSSQDNAITNKLKRELEKISVDKPKRKYIKINFN